MEREKRQAKPPPVYQIPKQCYPRIQKKKLKKSALKRADFQIIPAPLKFTCIASSFALYGVNTNYFVMFSLPFIVLCLLIFVRILD